MTTKFTEEQTVRILKQAWPAVGLSYPRLTGEERMSIKASLTGLEAKLGGRSTKHYQPVVRAPGCYV